METDFTITDQGGVSFLEGRPGVRLLNRTDDAGRVVEACLSSRAKSALLYAENLMEGFFYLMLWRRGCDSAEAAELQNPSRGRVPSGHSPIQPDVR
jgi:hypothetical protein